MTSSKLFLWVGIFAFVKTIAQEPLNNPEAGTNPSLSIPAPDILKDTDKVQINPRPIVRGETINIGNADRIVHHENRYALTYAKDRVVRKYGFEVDRIKGSAEWLHYSGTRFFGTFELQPKPNINFSGFAGIGQLKLEDFQKKPYGTTENLPLWKFRTSYGIIPRTDFRLEVSQDYSYMGWLDRSNNSQLMPVQSVFTEIESFSIESWQLRSNARWSHFGDTNHQEVFDQLVMKEFFRDPFGFGAGFGGGWMGCQQQVPGYGCPERLELASVRFVAWKDFARHWNFETRFLYGFHQEKNRPRGEETASEVHLRYRNEDGWFASLNGAFLNIEGGVWWKDEMSVNLEIPL